MNHITHIHWKKSHEKKLNLHFWQKAFLKTKCKQTNMLDIHRNRGPDYLFGTRILTGFQVISSSDTVKGRIETPHSTAKFWE